MPGPPDPAALKRVLIFVAIPTHFPEMIRVARLLRASGRYEPRMFFSAEYMGWERDEQVCRAAGVGSWQLFSDEFQRDWMRPRQDGQAVAPVPAAVAAAPAPAPVSASVAAVPGTSTAPTTQGRGLRAKLPRPLAVAARPVWRWIYRRYWGMRMFLWSRLVALAGYAPWKIWWAVLVEKGGVLRPSATAGKTLAQRFLSAFGKVWESERPPISLLHRKNLFRALPEFFRHESIALLVLPEDNHFLDTHFYVHAAKRNSAASAIVPFTIVNSLEWAETFHGRTAHRVWWPPNLLMARAFPHWQYRHKGHTMIMPAVQILICEYLRLTPPRPWLINSGYSDALAAEAPFMVDYYREAGIDPARIELVGALAEDEMFAAMANAREDREQLYRNLGMPAVLISVPPNQLIGDGRPHSEFSSYATMMKTMLRVACECGEWNVVLSPHPRLTEEDLASIVSEGIAVSTMPIASLVPLCEFFIASASTTIRLACVAGKPAVNYDVYQYGYTDFVDMPGVTTVSDLQSYKDAVKSLAGDTAYRGEQARKQRAFNEKRALFDGRSGERMLALFDRLTG
jgi:hypothetical protein